jgi:Flp pilus assembly protein TadB
VPLPVWIALFLVLFCLTAGTVFVFLRFRVFWRAFKNLGSALDAIVPELNSSLEKLDASTAAYEAGRPRLDASLQRLRRSLGRAAVLLAAVNDVKEAFAGVTAVLPRK